jgi:DNA repair protein RecN (Recombination protein N)
LIPFFEENDLDYENDHNRREILPGKSRAFINDSPVNQELQELSLFLIDIHSQQQTQELSDENVQFDIIAIANNKETILNIRRF